MGGGRSVVGLLRSGGIEEVVGVGGADRLVAVEDGERLGDKLHRGVVVVLVVVLGVVGVDGIVAPVVALWPWCSW